MLVGGSFLFILFPDIMQKLFFSYPEEGIVLATVAYSKNIISREFFTVLILTTMLSSMIAGYYLRHIQKKDPKIFNSL